MWYLQRALSILSFDIVLIFLLICLSYLQCVEKDLLKLSLIYSIVYIFLCVVCEHHRIPILFECKHTLTLKHDYHSDSEQEP